MYHKIDLSSTNSSSNNNSNNRNKEEHQQETTTIIIILIILILITMTLTCNKRLSWKLTCFLFRKLKANPEGKSRIVRMFPDPHFTDWGVKGSRPLHRRYNNLIMRVKTFDSSDYRLASWVVSCFPTWFSVALESWFLITASVPSVFSVLWQFIWRVEKS